MIKRHYKIILYSIYLSQIEYIKAYKVFDYIQLPTEESFVDLRIDFDGIGTEDELYNLELKFYPESIVLIEKLKIQLQDTSPN